MSSLRVLAGIAALAVATPASAQDAQHPLYRLVERERSAIGPVRLASLLAPSGGGSTLDCVHAAHDITLDPTSGAAVARLDLTVRAKNGPLAQIGLLVDEGLAVSGVSAEGRAASAADTVTSPLRAVTVSLSPPLAAGAETTVHVTYGGTLACGAATDTGAIVCTKGQDFSTFSQRSVFPWIFDPASADDATLDTLTRDITLHVPAGVDVVATGERVLDATDGAVHTSQWTIDQPLSRVLGLYVIAGKLGLATVPGRKVPTTLVYPAPARDVDQRLLGWSAPVLDFVEKIGGARLPFQRSMTLVRLPADLGDPGTATFGMTLLSDSYVRAGDLMHEETWLHENSHLFWGIVVPETDSQRSRLTTEGLATLSELDYTYTHHFAGEDRDRYLARRFVPIGIDLRTQGKDLPPVELGLHQQQPDALRTPLYTLWAYYKTSAALDHLRETLGDDVFEGGLEAYVDQCKFKGCGPTELRLVMEQTSGKELETFFARWINGSSRPVVTIGLRKTGAGAEVTLAKDDARPMTLALVVTREDGTRTKQRVDLGGKATTLLLSGDVRSVEASPRHDVMVDARPALAGDLDFDGETDGNDLLRCSRLVGTAYKTTNALGLWNVSESFDPRCDANGDLRIDDDDLVVLAESFGTLREP